jgi:DNA polymerase-3 subunit beta
MKNLIINSAIFLHALEFAKKAISKNPCVPIIENFFCQVLPGNLLRVSASDLQSTCACLIPAEAREVFSFLVDPTVLPYLKKLGESLIKLEFDPESYSVIIIEQDVELIDKNAPKAEFKINDMARAKFSGENVVDYPKAPEVNEDYAFIPLYALAEIKDLLNYVSKDELRPAMTGINFGYRQTNFEMTATDGHAMKLVSVPELARTEYKTSDIEQGFILPAKPAKILSDFKKGNDPIIYVKTKIEPLIEVEYKNNKRIEKEIGTKQTIINAKFVIQNDFYTYEITSRTINEQYPQYWNVIPEAKNTVTRYTASKKDFLKTLDKTAMFANKTTHQVRLFLNGKQTLSAEDLDFSREYCGLIGGTYTGEQIEIGFNAEYLKQVIESFGDNFTLELIAPNKAGIIRDANKTALVMPVMLTKYE